MQKLSAYTYQFLLVLSLASYLILAQGVDRSQSAALITLIAVVFFSYLALVKKELPLWVAITTGLAFRFAYLGSTPVLSQDFYRFIWDGKLLIEGISPYSYLPEELIAHPKFTSWADLYTGMGPMSAGHYSNYPMFNQVVFALGVLTAYPIATYRLLIIGADIAIYTILYNLGSPNSKKWALTYWLCPLVIIEGAGNLHFESIMVLLLLFGLNLLYKNHFFKAGVALSASVLLKAIPLLFAPLLLNSSSKRQFIKLSIAGLITLLIGVLPFLNDELASNYWKSFGLWFSNFEFNSGGYRVFKELGILLGYSDWQLIRFYGKIHSALILGFALLLSLRTKNLVTIQEHAYLLLLVYLLSTPTVHPWYLITLVALGALNQRVEGLIWSFTVMISYWAYALNPIELPFWAVLLQIVPIIALLSSSAFRSFVENRLL